LASSGSAGRVEVFDEPEALARAAAELFAASIAADVDWRGRCDLALAGGSTPRRAYELLAALRVPWPALHVWFGDERCVAPDHPDSNHALARAALLDRAPISPDHVHRMRGEEGDRDAAARAYERELPRSLDLLVLGIGPDGHTASLFPRSAALGETLRRVVAVVGPKPPPHRLTITPPVIAAARRVVVLAAGGDKAQAVRRALHDPVDAANCPAGLLRGARWLLDRAAAAGIARPSGAAPAAGTARSDPEIRRIA